MENIIKELEELKMKTIADSVKKLEAGDSEWWEDYKIGVGVQKSINVIKTFLKSNVVT